jgi:hypothetical protein
MNYKISFQEMEKKNKEILSKQPPVSLEQARAQVKRVKERSIQKNKKKKI